jgi:hypothetical protein
MYKFRECKRECLRVLVLLIWGYLGNGRSHLHKLGTDNESWVWVWVEEGAVVGNNESILPLPFPIFPIEAVLTCCPGEGANDGMEPSPLEWTGVCPNEVERNKERRRE